jgi:hypothetical protein
MTGFCLKETEYLGAPSLKSKLTEIWPLGDAIFSSMD